jgi:hypothetical protein
VVFPSEFVGFSEAAHAEHQQKWNPRARKNISFYKLRVPAINHTMVMTARYIRFLNGRIVAELM